MSWHDEMTGKRGFEIGSGTEILQSKARLRRWDEKLGWYVIWMLGENKEIKSRIEMR